MLERIRLEHHKSAHCHVLIDNDGTINFISYSTLVIKAEPGENGIYYLICTGTYSPTTRRQIVWFFKRVFR